MQAHVKVFLSPTEMMEAVLSPSAIWRMTEVGIMKFPLNGTVAAD